MFFLLIVLAAILILLASIFNIFFQSKLFSFSLAVITLILSPYIISEFQKPNPHFLKTDNKFTYYVHANKQTFECHDDNYGPTCNSLSQPHIGLYFRSMWARKAAEPGSIVRVPRSMLGLQEHNYTLPKHWPAQSSYTSLDDLKGYGDK